MNDAKSQLCRVYQLVKPEMIADRRTAFTWILLWRFVCHSRLMIEVLPLKGHPIRTPKESV